MTLPDSRDLASFRNGWAPRPGPLVGEVIESSTSDFLAQACHLDGAPRFGSFVQVAMEDLTTYGIVAQVQMEGIDPGARPIMRGHGDVRNERIYTENPDLPYVLRTTFRVLTLGYRQGGAIRQILPPSPPRLHYSVLLMAGHEVEAFTDAGLHYLHVLLNATDVPTEEVVAASIRSAVVERGDGMAFMERAGRELAQLLRTDYPRLTVILRRVMAGA